MNKLKIRSLSPAGALVLLLAGSAAANEAPAEARHFSDSSNDRSPAVTAFPKYPSIARRDRIEGETTVCFHIDARGRVVRPSIRNSTHKIFDKAAMRAIRDSSFTPLEKGAKPGPARTCRTYRFRLDPVKAENSEPAMTGVGGSTPADARHHESVP